MPEIALCWTLRAKAAHIIRHRYQIELTKFAKQEFRRSSPPLYSCARCDEIFVLKGSARIHKINCTYNHATPKYISWVLCEPIVTQSIYPFMKSVAQKPVNKYFVVL